MAEVYKYADNRPGRKIMRWVPVGNGGTERLKASFANEVERVVALDGDVQMAVQRHGKGVAQRAHFRMGAVQARHMMRLRENVQTTRQAFELAKANKEKPSRIEQLRLKSEKAVGDLDWYMTNRTRVIDGQADIDYHIMLYRPDGNEFFVEVDGKGDRGFEILTQSLTH